MFGFRLDDFDSITAGVRVTNPPTLTPTAKTFTQLEVVGGEGGITRDTGWQETSYSIGLLAPSMLVVEQLAAACVNAAKITLSLLPDRYQLVTHAAISELSRFGHRWLLTLNVTVKPFFYLHAGDESMQLSTGENQIVNPYPVYANPIFTFTGEGTITLQVNGEPFRLQLPGSGELIVDSGQMTCTVSGVYLYDALKAATFPRLLPGVNIINLPAGVACVLTPKWRTL